MAIVALNGECKDLDGCQKGSPEEEWLRADLKSHPAACTLAYWHEPLFSSGAKHGDNPAYRDFWRDLYDARATIVLNCYVTTTNGSSLKIPTARPTRRAAFANLWSAPAEITNARLPRRLSQTAKCA